MLYNYNNIFVIGELMNQEQFEKKLQHIEQVKMNAVSLIIIQLLIFITYTVKIMSEAFENSITFNIGNNNILDFGILLLLLSIVILVFALIPFKTSLDFDNPKKVKYFIFSCKMHQLIYVIGYYLMAFGIYYILIMILIAVGVTSLMFQVLLIILLSVLVFTLIKSITDIMFN